MFSAAWKHARAKGAPSARSLPLTVVLSDSHWKGLITDIGVAALDSLAMKMRHAKIGVAENSKRARYIDCFLERIEVSG